MLIAAGSLQEADLVSVLLGLLINLAEGSRSSCRRLLCLPPACPPAGPQDIASSSQANTDFLRPASLLSNPQNIAGGSQANTEYTQPAALLSEPHSQQQDPSAAAEAPSLLQLLCLLTQVHAVL